MVLLTNNNLCVALLMPKLGKTTKLEKVIQHNLKDMKAVKLKLKALKIP